MSIKWNKFYADIILRMQVCHITTVPQYSINKQGVSSSQVESITVHALCSWFAKYHTMLYMVKLGH